MTPFHRSMQKTIAQCLAAAATSLVLVASAGAAPAEDVATTWLTHDGQGVVEIAPICEAQASVSVCVSWPMVWIHHNNFFYSVVDLRVVASLGLFELNCFEYSCPCLW